MSSPLLLLPEPKHIRMLKGALVWPRRAAVGIADGALYPAASVAATFLHVAGIHASAPGLRDDLALGTDAACRPGGYRLDIRKAGVTITGHDAAAVASGVQTLRQIAQQHAGDALPCLSIDDWPDFCDRGVYYDVCRGRVPKLERLMELADQLARYKINQLQLYIEHTFAFRGHPKIGSGASPLTAEDILQLDDHCAARGIELVPSLASFGHLATVLHHPQYRHLAEDWGVGRYVAPIDTRPAWFRRKAWSLSPAVPEVYPFLDSLFAEFLPLFRSPRFNICCDETLDLGLGQSYELCRRKGKGAVYLEHIKKVRGLCRKYGKKVMFWGDIIRHYPELIAHIPKDVTVLDWGYAHDHPFARIKDLADAGLPFYACPGTSAWVSLFPRLPEAMANIHGFAVAGHRYGARGLLNTDWGDGGHHNFMAYSWHGYLFGAEQAWNVKADRGTFHRRFARMFLKSDDPALVDAIVRLGDITHLGGPCYQSVWQTVLFASATDAIFQHTEPIAMSVAENGAITTRTQPFHAALGEAQLAPLRAIRETLVAQSRRRGVDPRGVLPYWIFAVDTLTCAARKLAVLGPGGVDTPVARRALRRELRSLMRRFETLWLARNRRSEIRITLKRYQVAIDDL